MLLSTLYTGWAECLPSSKVNCSIAVERDVYPINAGMKSELRRVYESLIECPDTDSLRLTLYAQRSNFEDDPLNFEFLAGARFPRLRDLTLDGYDFGELQPIPRGIRWHEAQSAMKPMLPENSEAYSLPPSQILYVPGAHLDNWRRAMDWTALHSLKLSNVDNIFFWKMKGALPALKSLTIRDNHGLSNATNYMTNFLTSLNPLTNLSAHGYTDSIDWPQALERHGSTLRSLKIQDWLANNSNDSKSTLSVTQLEEIRHWCPGLNELSVNIEMNAELPYEALDEIASNTYLTKLTLRLRGNQNSRGFGSKCQTYGLPQDLASEDENEEVKPQLPFIGPQTVLQIFHHLRSQKRGLELLELDVYVGNHEIGWRHSYPEWIDRYSTSTSKHVCNIFNEEGNGKREGEAWCHCEGTCKEYASMCFPY